MTGDNRKSKLLELNRYCEAAACFIINEYKIDDKINIILDMYKKNLEDRYQKIVNKTKNYGDIADNRQNTMTFILFTNFDKIINTYFKTVKKFENSVFADYGEVIVHSMLIEFFGHNYEKIIKEKNLKPEILFVIRALKSLNERGVFDKYNNYFKVNLYDIILKDKALAERVNYLIFIYYKNKVIYHLANTLFV